VLGEFFMAIEPFCNMDLEEQLGNLGVEVTRGAWVSDWAKIWLFLEALGISHGQKVKKAAAPYLSRDVSGDAVQSIGETVLHADEGFDGVVHLQPFTCMPEIIAQSLLPKVSRDHDIPVLCVILDEQMGRAGLQTRLEAFVDLMRRRHRQAAAARLAS
jgi:predicted nucleotide-binding protein (sugar kinase/HSP70/actin superfamily)